MDIDRRLSGVLVLACAAIVVVVISGGARAVPGSANPAPVPPAPAVGDCLLDKPLAWRPGGQSTVAMDIGACDPAQRFGEISAVKTQTAGDYDVCLDGAGSFDEYAGLSQLFTPKAGWQPRIHFTATILEPDARQRAAGQTWSACLLTPANSQQSYQSSLEDSFLSGRFPAEFAQCQYEADVFLSLPGSCVLPHTTEFLGEQVLFGDNIDEGELNESCRALAVIITGMSAPAAGGQLQILATVFPTDQTRMNEDQQRMHIALCTIGSAGDRLLTGTLIGLGSAPIPWAR